MINSYQVKITTDSQNEENTIRGLRERLETALLPAIDDEPQSILVSKANDAIRHAEQEAHCARVAVSERDEMCLIGQRAVQERDAKMNEEIKIARDRAQQGHALQDRATLRDHEFVDVTRELAVSRQKANDAKPDYLNQIAAMSEEIEETRRELKIQESFVYQLAETNKEHESENATQIAVAADTKDRGRALLRDDTVRTGKRHNSKTRKSDTTNGLQQQGQVVLYQATVAASSLTHRYPLITALDRVLLCFLFTKTQ